MSDTGYVDSQASVNSQSSNVDGLTNNELILQKATHAGRGGGKDTFKYDVRRIADAVSIATLLSAPLINFLAMLALYFITDMVKRMVIILVFTHIFSIIMSALTNSRTANMFAATAAYSAVLVVFVGNPNVN